MTVEPYASCTHKVEMRVKWKLASVTSHTHTIRKRRFRYCKNTEKI